LSRNIASSRVSVFAYRGGDLRVFFTLVGRSAVKYVGWAKNDKQKFTTVVNLGATMDPVR